MLFRSVPILGARTQCLDAICGHVTAVELWCIFHTTEKLKNLELILSRFPQNLPQKIEYGLFNDAFEKNLDNFFKEKIMFKI